MSKTKRVGHSGTLDPMATGVLPVFIGMAAKACDIMPIQDKCYRAGFKLGVTTDTQDISGNILTQGDYSHVTIDDIKNAAGSFCGDIMQVPPMYSAIKVNGQKLYSLARQGIEVERKARPVTIYDIKLVEADLAANSFSIDVSCSKGTYIRTVCHDIGERLGCGAVMTSLCRTMAGGFTLDDCITLEQAQSLAEQNKLEDALIPVSKIFATLPQLKLNSHYTRLFKNGVRLDIEKLNCRMISGDIAVTGSDGVFLGIAQIERETGLLKLKKLFDIINDGQQAGN